MSTHRIQEELPDLGQEVIAWLLSEGSKRSRMDILSLYALPDEMHPFCVWRDRQGFFTYGQVYEWAELSLFADLLPFNENVDCGA